MRLFEWWPNKCCHFPALFVIGTESFVIVLNNSISGRSAERQLSFFNPLMVFGKMLVAHLLPLLLLRWLLEQAAETIQSA